MTPLYELISNKDELKIAEKIKQRRLQILVHSYIYYELDQNIVSDQKWAEWGRELSNLQKEFPNIASKVDYAEDFVGFDASTGQGLPYMNSEIISIANRLLSKGGRNSGKSYFMPEKPKAPTPKKKPSASFNLF